MPQNTTVTTAMDDSMDRKTTTVTSTMKRSIKDRTNRTRTKRRRVGKNDEARNTSCEETIPMEIDEIEGVAVLSSTIATNADTIVAAGVPTMASSNKTVSVKKPRHVTIKVAPRTSQLQQPSTRHVPRVPPTPQQILQRLYHFQKPKHKKSDTQKPLPQAPPPSPFSPRQQKQPLTPDTKSSFVSTHNGKVPAEKATTLWLRNAIVPLIMIMAISLMVVSTATFLPPSKQPSDTSIVKFQNNNNLSLLNRHPRGVHPHLKECSLGLFLFWKPPFFLTKLFSDTPTRLFPHIVPPRHVAVLEGKPHESYLSNMTLRDFLVHDNGIHLGMAPAFFGFYAYFGALAAWNEELSSTIQENFLSTRIASVAGGSAGAMAAVLIAAGIHPRRAAQYCSTMTLSKFADPPGLGAIFKGNVFEELMKDFIVKEGNYTALENANIPVAVSAFDLKSVTGKIINKGCMARAARASATFPLLFQPLYWEMEGNNNDTAYLIDGGVTDGYGLMGLSVLNPHESNKRIVNLVVGNSFPSDGPRGPSKMPDGVLASQVLSISIQNTPLCGPWAMSNGPRAVEASSRAMKASLDIPLYMGNEPGHYELHIDATDFVP